MQIENTQMPNDKNRQIDHNGNMDRNAEMPFAIAVTNKDLQLYKVHVKPFTNCMIYTTILFVVVAILLNILLPILNRKFANTTGSASNVLMENITTIFISVLVIVIYIGLCQYIKVMQKKQFNRGEIERYEFFQDYILQRTVKNGEWVGEIKIDYKDIVRKSVVTTKEKQYLKIYYPSKLNLHYIDLQMTSDTGKKWLQEQFKVQFTK